MPAIKSLSETLACNGCPMREKFPDHHFVPPQEPKNPAHDLVRLVIAEAPGERESEVGEPLRGKAGQFFDKLLEDAGIQRDGLTITNCLSCRPPDNIFPTDRRAWSSKSKRCYISKEDGVKAVHHCKENHLDPLLRSRKWNRVDLVGGHALRIVAQKEGISEWRGRPLKLPSGHKAIAILHPSYLMTYNKSMRENTLNDLRKSLEESAD
jgi:uracil-DNA glycosylase family 4